MYADHFALTAEPFNLTPDPSFLYLSPEHREALAALQYGLVDGRGFITLIGEVGTGKTTLLYSLLGRLGDEIQTAYVAYTTQSFEDILAAVLKDLRVETAGQSKRDLLEALNAHLLRRAEQGRSTALIIDEAQNLDDSTFEELRLLSNFETYERKLLQIVLVGQPELQQRLRSPRLRQLRERVSVRAVINPLPRAEMIRYIEHRLERVGGSASRLFSPGALRRIVARSQGIPRRANILCHNALLFAYGKALQQVPAQLAREAVAEMDERRPGLLGRSAVRRARPGRILRWAAVLGAIGAVALAASRPLLEHPAATVSQTLTAVPPAAPVPAPAPAEVATTKAPPPAQAARAADRDPAVAEVPTPENGVPTRGPAPVEQPREPSEASATQTGETAGPPPAREESAMGSPAALKLLTVGRGETLWSIARGIYGEDLRQVRAGEFLAEVQRLNPQMKDPNVIRTGERLRFPAAVPSEAPAAR